MTNRTPRYDRDGDGSVDRVSPDWRTVGGTSISDLDAAESAFRYVRGVPGRTYTGNGTLSVGSDGAFSVVDLRQCTLDGSGVVVDIDAQNAYGTSGGTIVLLGEVKSDGTAGSRAVRVTDSEDVQLDVQKVSNSEYGVFVRNMSWFCENMDLQVRDMEAVDYGVRLHGQSTTGGDGGTDSFRQFRAYIQGHANEAVYYESEADTYASDISVSAFIDAGQTALRLDGGKRGTVIRPWVEHIGDPAAGVGIKEGSESGIPETGCIIFAPDLRHLATDYDMSTALPAMEFSNARLKMVNTATGSVMWDLGPDSGPDIFHNRAVRADAPDGYPAYEMYKQGTAVARWQYDTNADRWKYDVRDGSGNWVAAMHVTGGTDSPEINVEENKLANVGTQVDSAGFSTSTGGFDIIGITDQDPGTSGTYRWIKIHDPDGNTAYIPVEMV
jgi:hypothetical protein